MKIKTPTTPKTRETAAANPQLPRAWRTDILIGYALMLSVGYALCWNIQGGGSVHYIISSSSRYVFAMLLANALFRTLRARSNFHVSSVADALFHSRDSFILGFLILATLNDELTFRLVHLLLGAF